MAGRYTFRTKIRRSAAGIHPPAVRQPPKGGRGVPRGCGAGAAGFFVWTHEAISRIFASASPGPSMRIAPPKVNTHEKNGGVGATSTVARKWLASTTSVSTSSPK